MVLVWLITDDSPNSLNFPLPNIPAVRYRCIYNGRWDLVVHWSEEDSVPKVVITPACMKKLMEDYHAGVMSGHFSGPRIYKTMSH